MNIIRQYKLYRLGIDIPFEIKNVFVFLDGIFKNMVKETYFDMKNMDTFRYVYHTFTYNTTYSTQHMVLKIVNLLYDPIPLKYILWINQKEICYEIMYIMRINTDYGDMSDKVFLAIKSFLFIYMNMLMDETMEYDKFNLLPTDEKQLPTMVDEIKIKYHNDKFHTTI